MSCEICLLDSTADAVLWNCIGCSRAFHAACVGVSVQRNSLRKKDKKIDVLSYVLPCCSSCQTLITLNFEVQLLTKQQAELAEKVESNTKVTHRATKQINASVLNEGICRLEGMLIEIQKELTAVKSSGSAGTKNHITSLCDIAMKKSKENLSSLMDSMTSGLTNDLKHLNEQIRNISSTTEFIASGNVMFKNPMLGTDIMEELKSLSANVNSIESKIICHSPDAVDSLEDELNEVNNIHPVQSGWRFLGTKKVWKADWTDYDKRELHRLKQQKQAENARKRKNQSRKKNSNKTHFNRSQTSRPSNIQDNRHQYSRHEAHNIMRDHSGNSLLPPDRLLLAAAKERFSKPPRYSSSDAPTIQRPIQFQRGEILNPYPPHDEVPRSSPGRQPNWTSPGATSYEMCQCHAHHSCFLRN